MTRVKRGVVAHKKRERRLKAAKGYRWSRSTKEKAAKEALTHAYTHMFRGRKERKRDFRALWNVKINAAIRPLGMNYNQFISALKKKNIKLDRKILAHMAEFEPKVFGKVVEAAK